MLYGDLNARTLAGFAEGGGRVGPTPQAARI